MSLAIFDLDNTLLADDSDYLWGQFLVDQGKVNAAYYEQENERFYQEYKAGTLDINKFLKFSLKPLADNSLEDLHNWRAQFMINIIQPILLKPAQALVKKHHDRGDTLLIITATNSFVTSPIAKSYEVANLLATTPELVNGQFTGKTHGTPCFQEGKVTRLNQWLQKTKLSLEGSYFYSDSHNDLPLLKLVTYPIAVNPDELLRQYAIKENWPIISLRDEECPTQHLKESSQ
jgi:HAD superfamily hydrolase (TIGR01490 family)